MKRFTLCLVFALAAAWVILITAWSALYTEKLLRPACSRAETLPPPGFEAITLTTPQGISLSGWWHPPQNGAVVLLVGGLGASRDSMLPEAQILAGAGYGALTLESRACAGVPGTLGYAETAELQAMFDYAQPRSDVEWIGALGFSVGGVTVLHAAAENPGLLAVAAQGNFANLHDEITHTPSAFLSPQWQAQRLVLLFYQLRTGLPPRAVSPIDDLPQIPPRPVLLVHGERELARTAGREQAAACSTAALWVVPQAGHGQYHARQPKEYARRMISFFDSARGHTQPVEAP